MPALIRPSRVDEELRTALAVLLDGLPPSRAARAVERLITTYRGHTPTHAPVLRDRDDAVAYAAYRMPATFGAVAAALAAFADRLPGWAPDTHLDVGGGTGAAVWAAVAAWGEEGGPDCRNGRRTTVVDWAEPALALGRELTEGSASPALRATRWQRHRIGGEPELPPTDLVTVSYVLGELAEEDRRAVVEAVARSGKAVVVIEPGTPDGYARVMAARDRLIAAGLRVLAPCPHSETCPILAGQPVPPGGRGDWCHFAARVSRSSLHRRVKGGSLPYEDEKYAFVAAVRPGTGDDEAVPATARVVRKPQIRKGQVLLELCTADEALTRRTVTKREGLVYRGARGTGWGDSWPPPESR